MNGQLWQPCAAGRCKVEPVCVNCERCEKHCACEQAAADAAEIAEFERAYPGELERHARHMEQGAQECD